MKLGKPIRLSKLYRNSKPPLEDAPLWQVVTHSCLSRMAALGKPIARGGFLRYSGGFISSYVRYRTD